jgi:hypothetical protein
MWKRFILWDFPRASWQYDVMVGIIVAFVLFMPRAWFRDQPRIPRISVLPSEHDASVFWIEPELLSGVQVRERVAKANDLLRTRTGKRQLTVVRVEPIYGSEEELKGFMAFPEP